MSPCLTFIKINNKSVIPIRIHVNRKRLSSKLFHSAVDLSHKSKALLTLKKINLIRISNRDITSLTSSISKDILEYLLHFPINELLKLLSNANSEIPVPPNSLCIDLNNSAWKCHVVVPILYVIKLRSHLFLPVSEEDWVLYNKLKPDSGDSTINLLTKQATMLPVKVLVEDGEENNFTIAESAAKKQALSYKFENPHVLTKLGRFMDIYVYERPSRVI